MVKKIKGKVFLIGDIHGGFHVIKSNIARGYLNDSTLIQLGDFGLGFNGEEFREMSSLNKVLAENNVHLIALRGNHDCPDCWENNFIRTLFNETFSNIELVPNGKYLEINGKTAICINGGVSIDRKHRKENVSYWKGEEVNIDLLQKYKLTERVDIVLSHSCPQDYFYLDGLPNLEKWHNNDTDLQLSLNNERAAMKRTFDLCKPESWFFGHFHDAQKGEFKGCKWRCLDINEIDELIV